MQTLADPLTTRGLPHRFYRWELLALLCGAFFLHQGDRAIFGVALTSIRADLGLSDQQMGAVGTALFATLAVMMPLAGYVGDIGSRKWIITVSLVFWSGATMLTGLARGVLSLILFRSVATAGGESFYAPAAYPLLAAYHHKTRSLAMAFHQGALYVGVIAGGIVGGAITQHYGWRSTFHIFGGAGIGLGLLLAVRLKNAPPAPADDREVSDPARGCLRTDNHVPLSLRERAGVRGHEDGLSVCPPFPQSDSSGIAGSSPSPLPSPGGRGGLRIQSPSPREVLAVMRRTPTAWLLTVGFTAIVLVNNAYVVWAPAFIEEKFGLSVADAGGYSMLYHHLAALVGVLVGGQWSDMMVGRRRTFRLELQTAAMFLGVPAILAMGLARDLTTTWIAMAALGVFRGLFEANTHASLFDVIPPRCRASAVGLMVMVAFLAGSLSPALLGFCRGHFPAGQGLSYGFAALSLAYLMGAIAMLAAARFTFRKDYCEESPLQDAPLSEDHTP